MPKAPADPILAELFPKGTERPVTFDRFMEAVLYHPHLGYYSKDAQRAGRGGDFLTAPETAPLFGACVARWLERLWRELGEPEFDVVEVGAGRGTLARSLLEAVSSPFRRRLRLHLVDRSPAARRALEDAFREGTATIYGSPGNLPSRIPSGAFVSNELFDNLPVRRIMRTDQGWMEIVLRLERGRLREGLVEAPQALAEEARSQGIELDAGQSAEVCLQSVPLLESILGRIDEGGLLLFDYGGEAAEVSGAAAPQGTLATHRHHSRDGDLYSTLGEKDITAHVNFTPLRAAAQHLGFRPALLESQSEFLVQNGLPELFVSRIEREPDEFERLKITQWSKQLYHPEAMGEAFRVLHATKRQ